LHRHRRQGERLLRRADGEEAGRVRAALSGRRRLVAPRLTDVERAEESRAFVRAVLEGLSDLEEGRELTLRDVKARLGLGQQAASVEPSTSPRRFRG
ncbi:MAG: hypothetical protein OXU81_07015, partial [Gammaproteobacteria bacterium]|nr:hypothetical protein [Gammaproteobacteria bacterium]